MKKENDGECVRMWGKSRQVAKGDRQKVRQRKMKGEKSSSFLLLGLELTTLYRVGASGNCCFEIQSFEILAR